MVPYGIKVALRDTEPGSDAHRAVIDVALAASRFSAASMKHTIPIAAEAAASDHYPLKELARALNLLVERAAQLHRHDELTWAVWGLAKDRTTACARGQRRDAILQGPTCRHAVSLHA